MSFAARPIGLVKSAFVWRPTISADATNWVLYSQAIAAGWDGVVPLDAEVTVGSGIVLSANSTSQYGFDTGTTFPAGSTLALINNGFVIGMGGAGGAPASSGPAIHGKPGGPALRALAPIAVTNNGTIGGGGGGGGAGMWDAEYWAYGGGGGRTGRTDSLGGAGNWAAYTPRNGTFAAPGPAQPDTPDSYGGGGGGQWGQPGTAGSGSGAGAAGAAGAAVVGNSYITWVNTGTRYGAIT